MVRERPGRRKLDREAAHRGLLGSLVPFGGKRLVLLLALGGGLGLGLASGFLERSESALIRVYQYTASPLLARVVTCRFEPTCSVYALQVLSAEGFWVGNYRIARRLFFCSPWGWWWEEALRPAPTSASAKGPQSPEVAEPAPGSGRSDPAESGGDDKRRESGAR